MTGDAPLSWEETSTRALKESLERLLARVAHRAGRTRDEPPPIEPPPGSALEEVVRRFGLTSFERDLLLLCVGCELDSRFGELVGVLEEDPARRSPTFSLALAMLDGGHWSALAPGAVLRRARLLALGDSETLATRTLAVEETVLHHLLGRPQLDERLRPYVAPAAEPELLTAGQGLLVERLAVVWAGGGPGVPAAVQLLGGDAATCRAVAAHGCRRAGLNPFVLEAGLLPADPASCEELFELWARDAILGDLALILELRGTEPASPGRRSARQLLERLNGFVVVTGEPLAGDGARRLVRIEVTASGAGEQRQAWMAALGPRADALDGQLERLVQQFTLAPGVIREVAAEVAWDDDGEAGEVLWQACRRRARGGLDDLAQRIEAVAGWDDLVLPAPQMAVLHQVATHVRQRARVYEDWGFARHSPRGLGINALFAGASGTGKTMAAEVLARDLGLDLYRIDLSAIISKYIGETEKNLRRIFDAAESSGAILLFDEADALFGHRSQVKDSHDRYANLEISYLLQRIETYRGLAILTTNLQRHLDDAFVRRLRFILQFPHPGPAERAEIWQRIFPPETPLADLDVGKLARLSVTGGHIKSIALAAAVLAADEDRAVDMGHLLQAARAEYGKLGKPLSEAEVKGWR